MMIRFSVVLITIYMSAANTHEQKKYQPLQSKMEQKLKVSRR